MEEMKTNGKKTAAQKPSVPELFDLMKSEDIQELELKEGDYYVYLKRKGNGIPQMMQFPMNMQPQMLMPQIQTVPQQSAVSSEPRVVETKGETIKSPIIGTFYRSPSPASPTFVKEGDIVDVGKTVCIVEAMKVMNEIKAEGRAKILKILVENGKPVTAGQDLFIIEKN